MSSIGLWQEDVLGVMTDVWAWAERNFATAQLGDRRRTRRLVESAARIAAHPEKAFPQIFDWNDLRGFYRVCDRQETTLAAVMQPHWDQTRQAMAEQPLVLIVHDTTELDFTSHHALTGIGPIGNERGRGLLQHNSLAIVPRPRQVLGLAYQQCRVRQPAPQGESTYQRKRRPRESDLWTEGIRAAGRPPAGCCWVDVADRGSDDYEVMRAAQAVGHHFLIRANQNRRVFVTADQDRQEPLLDYARTLPSQGRDVVAIPGRGGRPPRTATVSLAGAAVWVPAPSGTPKRQEQPVLSAWVIRIWEPTPPAEIREPLEWILICSVPTTTPEDLRTRRDWYCDRWMVETFHDIEKNGCREEARRFATAARLEACLGVLSVVAVRVFQLRCALESAPTASAEQVATTAEITVLSRHLGRTSGGLTVRAFVRGVAGLGGFLGRKHDGEPGVRALWRGYQRLQDMVLGYELHHSSASGYI
jgi:Transposase DNA-binding/Transposase Tn5 dimerisation domain